MEQTQCTRVSKINTASREKIDATISVGQWIRNGSGRWFEIVEITQNRVTLKPLNQEKGKGERLLNLNRKTFVDLYFLKNYEQILNKENPKKEILDSQQIGSDRFLL